MSRIETDPANTNRARAFELWMRAPNPMVTIIKSYDVMPLVDFCKRKGIKFNMLLNWCIGKAASSVKEFYTLPIGNKLYEFDRLAVNSIVENRLGEPSSCDVEFCNDLYEFNKNYLLGTQQVRDSCFDLDLSDNCMVIGTSAIVNVEFDAVIGMNSGIFNNPFITWGRYRLEGEKALLGLSFQFHHTQMDGLHAGRFLKNLETEIEGFKLI